MGGGGVAGFGWKLGVDLRLDGDVDWFIMMALSGLFSGFEHGGHQILGPNSQSYVVPDTRV
jgi:hypothetical protein